jgi:hypothetical protein
LENLSRKEDSALKDIAQKHDEALQLEETRYGNCVDTAKKRVKRDVDGDVLRQRQYVYRRRETAKFGTAAYFSGDAALVLKAPTPATGATPQKVIPRSTFTFEVWLKPEGGQIVGVPIVSKYYFLFNSGLTMHCHIMIELHVLGNSIFSTCFTKSSITAILILLKNIPSEFVEIMKTVIS